MHLLNINNNSFIHVCSPPACSYFASTKISFSLESWVKHIKLSPSTQVASTAWKFVACLSSHFILPSLPRLNSGCPEKPGSCLLHRKVPVTALCYTCHKLSHWKFFQPSVSYHRHLLAIFGSFCQYLVKYDGFKSIEITKSGCLSIEITQSFVKDSYFPMALSCWSTAVALDLWFHGRCVVAPWPSFKWHQLSSLYISGAKGAGYSILT